MQAPTPKQSGIALLISSVLIFVTMVLHPAGGSITHLISIAPVIIGTHALAIASVPISLFGFWGLANVLQRNSFFSGMGFAITCVSMVAVMLAAAINGLALPMFLTSFENAQTENHDLLRVVVKYNLALNHAFDYVFIWGICLAIACWSIAIIKTKALPLWLGFAGIVLALTAIAVFFTGYNLVGLQGFRYFIFGIVGWIVATGIVMTKQKHTLNDNR